MITVIVARSKERNLPSGIKPTPIVCIAQANVVIIYIQSEVHENHRGSEISVMRFHNTESAATLLEDLGVDAANLEKLHQIHYPRLHNGEIAEHLIFCFPESVKLSEKEEIKFANITLGKIAPDSSAAWAFHRNKDDGRKAHMHALVSNFHRKYFWRLRIRDLRSCDTREDYLEYVKKSAREAVEELNRDRGEKEHELIPTLVEVRAAKQEEKQAVEEAKAIEGFDTTEKDFQHFIEALAKQVSYWLPEGDDDELRKRVRDAINTPEVPWRISSEGEEYFKVIPELEDKTKAYTFPTYSIKRQVRDLFLEKAREPQENDMVVEQLAKSVGPTLYNSQNKTQGLDGLAIRDSLREIGYEARAITSTVEAKAPDGTLIRANARKLRELVYDHACRQIKADTLAFANTSPFTASARMIAAKTLSPEMADAPLQKRREMAKNYIDANARSTGESREGLIQLYDLGFLNWRWISLDLLFDELKKKEKADRDAKEKAEKESKRAKERVAEFELRLNKLAIDLGENKPLTSELAKRHGLWASFKDTTLSFTARIDGILCHRKLEYSEEDDLEQLRELPREIEEVIEQEDPPVEIDLSPRGQSRDEPDEPDQDNDREI